MVSNYPCLLVQSSPNEYGLDLVTHFQWIENNRSNGVLLLRLSYKKAMASVLSILSFSFSHHSLWRKLAAMFLVSPVEEFVWQGTEGGLQLIASRKQRPLANCPWGIETWQQRGKWTWNWTLPNGVCRWDYSPTDSLIVVSLKPVSQRLQDSGTKILDS